MLGADDPPQVKTDVQCKRCYFVVFGFFFFFLALSCLEAACVVEATLGSLALAVCKILQGGEGLL